MMKSKKGLTREQFLNHWEKTHAPMFLKKDVPGFSKYIQNHPAKGVGPEFETDIDGIAELGFDDVESAINFYRWHNSAPEAEDLREDGKLYTDIEGLSPLFLSEEHVLKE